MYMTEKEPAQFVVHLHACASEGMSAKVPGSTMLDSLLYGRFQNEKCLVSELKYSTKLRHLVLFSAQSEAKFRKTK